MSALFTIVIAAHLGAAGQELPVDWQIWSFKSSGRGGKNGIYVDSTGRNVAYVDTAGRDLRDLAKDLRRGVPTSYCEMQPLSEYQVRRFAFRIASIPSDVLEDGGLHIISDSCIAERTQGITLRMHGQYFYFGYSLCGNPDVPDWLSSLVEVLWARYRDIKACDATPLGADSVP